MFLVAVGKNPGALNIYIYTVQSDFNVVQQRMKMHQNVSFHEKSEKIGGLDGTRF